VPFTADTTLSTLMARVGARLPGHDALGPLAEVLEAAAEPEPGDRLDAAGFMDSLRELGGRLPPPERLPLAGPGGGGVVLPRPKAPAQGPVSDATEHGMDAPPPAASRRLLGRRRRDPDLLAVAAAVGLTGDALEALRRRKRWPWMAVVGVIAAALATVGTAFALHTTKLLVPSHRLVDVTGLTTDQANLKLHRARLHVATVAHRYSITVPESIIVREIPGKGTKMKEGSIVQVVLSSGPPPVAVPSLAAVTGDCPGVTNVLQQAHLQANCAYQNSTTVQRGGVIDWNPKTQAIYGTSISVIISSGPPTVAVPSLSGSTCQGATATLQALNLAASCSEQYSSSIPPGQVIDWNPKGTVPWGTTISIVVSKGPQPVAVPQIYGKTVSDAIAMLQGVGLNPVSGGGSLSGHVFLSDPAPGTQVLPGAQVTLYSR
jgi:beta-lactam-binding protein with PASTA domain